MKCTIYSTIFILLSISVQGLLCYQEDASVDTCGIGSVGSYSTDDVSKWDTSHPYSYVKDGNYNNYGQPVIGSQLWYYVNYSKPNYLYNQSFQVKTYGVINNYTIPDSCLMNSSVRFAFLIKGTTKEIRSYCYNSTGAFEVIFTDTDGEDTNRRLYEEAMYWYINEINLTSYIINSINIYEGDMFSIKYEFDSYLENILNVNLTVKKHTGNVIINNDALINTGGFWYTRNITINETAQYTYNTTVYTANFTKSFVKTINISSNGGASSGSIGGGVVLVENDGCEQYEDMFKNHQSLNNLNKVLNCWFYEFFKAKEKKEISALDMQINKENLKNSWQDFRKKPNINTLRNVFNIFMSYIFKQGSQSIYVGDG
jgi:hypothetical protein